MKPSQILAYRIDQRFADGFIVTETQADYIKNVFDIQDPMQLLNMDETGPDSQQASALDWIFFPDSAFRRDLEMFLQESGFTRSDEQEIIAFLREMESETRIVWNPVSLFILFPMELIPNFVFRLHMTRKLDERILGCMDRNIPGLMKTECCVRMRNHMIEWKNGHIRDMDRFMASGHSDPADFMTCFSDLLTMMSEGDMPDDLQEGLKQKKRFWSDCFHRAAEIQSRFQTSNAETMLLAGNRILSITPDQAMHQMDMLARILFRMS